jgi:hypothetical protein
MTPRTPDAGTSVRALVRTFERSTETTMRKNMSVLALGLAVREMLTADQRRTFHANVAEMRQREALERWLGVT